MRNYVLHDMSYKGFHDIRNKDLHSWLKKLRFHSMKNKGFHYIRGKGPHEMSNQYLQIWKIIFYEMKMKDFRVEKLKSLCHEKLRFS